jgi:hypothetical protein
MGNLGYFRSAPLCWITGPTCTAMGGGGGGACMGGVGVRGCIGIIAYKWQ